MNFTRLHKLGSASSEVFTSENTYRKIHRFATREEAETVIKGIELLQKLIPVSIELPISCRIEEERLDSGESQEKATLLHYEQAHLKPWIEASWISSAQLEELGELIIKQQEVLLGEGLCLVDARPSNYWLGSNQPRLVDLASIKKLSNHSLASFLADFLRHIIHPLLLEQQLGLPVSSYFKAGLANINIRTSGLLKSYQSIAMLKEIGRQSITQKLSTLISSASVDFIRFLREEAGPEGLKNNSNTKLIQHGLRRISRMDKLLKKACQGQNKSSSDWSHYGQVHQASYLEAKQKAVKEFLAESDQGTRVVDLGANITHASHQKIDLLIDQDISICRELWMLRSHNARILQLDVAEALCSPSSSSFSALNLGGIYNEAIILGLIHHLIIDGGLPAQAFFQGLSLLFKRILLEIPSNDDPMVQLLIRKKGEQLDWNINKHKAELENFYSITKTKKLLETRYVIEAEKK